MPPRIVIVKPWQAAGHFVGDSMEGINRLLWRGKLPIVQCYCVSHVMSVCVICGGGRKGRNRFVVGVPLCGKWHATDPALPCEPTKACVLWLLSDTPPICTHVHVYGIPNPNMYLSQEEEGGHSSILHLFYAFEKEKGEEKSLYLYSNSITKRKASFTVCLPSHLSSHVPLTCYYSILLFCVSLCVFIVPIHSLPQLCYSIQSLYSNSDTFEGVMEGRPGLSACCFLWWWFVASPYCDRWKREKRRMVAGRGRVHVVVTCCIRFSGKMWWWSCQVCYYSRRASTLYYLNDLANVSLCHYYLVSWNSNISSTFSIPILCDRGIFLPPTPTTHHRLVAILTFYLTLLKGHFSLNPSLSNTCLLAPHLSPGFPSPAVYKHNFHAASLSLLPAAASSSLPSFSSLYLCLHLWKTCLLFPLPTSLPFLKEKQEKGLRWDWRNFGRLWQAWNRACRHETAGAVAWQATGDNGGGMTFHIMRGRHLHQACWREKEEKVK